LGNTYRALGKRAQIIGEVENKKIKKAEFDDKALKKYEEAINTATTDSLKLRAKLSKLNLLVEIKPDSEVMSLATDIQSILENLETNIETVYARIDLAQSLTCLNVKNMRSEFAYPQPPIVNVCQSDSAAITSSIDDADLPKWEEIARLLVMAERQAEGLEDVRSQSYALETLGEVYEILQQFEEAKDVTSRATTIVGQYHQVDDILYRLEWQLGRLAWKGKGDRKEIIAAYETSFNSLENLQQNLGSLNADVQFNFRDEVEPAYRQFVDVLLQNAEPSQDHLKQARDIIEALQVAELNNFFREACLKPKTKEIDEIDPASAVIYPIILNDRIEVITSFSDLTFYHHLKVESDRTIYEVIDQFQKHLKQTEKDGDGNDKYLQEAKILYDWLIKPVNSKLSKQGVKTLVFVSDGLLKNLPMAALHDGKSLLIEKYNISVNSSLQLIEPQSLSNRIQKVLLAGAIDAPSFQQSEPKFNPLNGVEQEFNKISSIFSSRTLFEDDFTEFNLQNSIKTDDFQIVHIATHGKFSSNAENTFILTYNERLNSRQISQLIQVKEQNQSNPIEMLVLSACETAQGDRRAALGLAGVAIKAGARSTLATLWKVDDRATAEFMSEFYLQLKQNPTISKAEALRQSQIFFIEHSRYNHPYYWGAFVLLGSWL
ncbi:MAG: CHAT domain-containing protein, partial [Geitlerinemataceae cyanobacterium]